MAVKVLVILFSVVCLMELIPSSQCAVAEIPPTSERQGRRLHFPFTGPTCTGCPNHYCDDDPAIIHGYCCGCARFTDSIPVRCGGHLNCPLDSRGLCRDYEYMMSCCC